MRIQAARFSRHTGGSVAIIFTLAAIVLVGFVGAAVDYARAMSVRSKMSAAADAAALAAAARASQDLVAGASSWQTNGAAAATDYFAAQTATLAFATTTVPAVAVTNNGAAINASVSYSVDVPTTFLRITGISSITVSGQTQAATNILPYTDINVVIDVSTSMGIGATAFDQQTLFTSTGCALACHMSDVGGTVDSLAAARASGAELRIDVVKSAITQALKTINTLTVNNGQVRVAVYTLSNTLTNVYPLSSDIPGAVSAIAGIDLPQGINTGGTNTTYALQTIKPLLPTPGPGSSSSAPRGFVVLMTDGVQNSAQEATYDSVTRLYAMGMDPNFVPLPGPAPSMTSWGIETLQAFDPSACTPIKTKGYTLLTMNVEYLIPAPSLYLVDRSGNPADTSGRFPFIQTNLLSGIAANMQACASTPDLAFSASRPADIATATGDMFQKILAMAPHLTQ